MTAGSTLRIVTMRALGREPVVLDRFPAEFSGLLSQAGRRRVAALGRLPPPVTHHNPLGYFEGLLDRTLALQCTRLLDTYLYDSMEWVDRGIPRDSMRSMRTKNSETLPKTMRVRTSSFHRPRSSSTRAGRSLGLIEMLESQSLRDLAQSATGLRLHSDPGVQALLYETGCSIGPHNDHHPENPYFRQGYVDVHISLPNSSVSDQFLVFEKGGHFSQVQRVTALGAVAVYRLPFWHYVTPLVAKPLSQNPARRWLLLATYAIARGVVRR
jgi:hypothetical protein